MKKFLRHEYDDIGRIYIFDDGSKYYSVTTMLGATGDKKFLVAWKKRIGVQRAEAITRCATNTGNIVHECLEQYLLGNEVQYPNAVIKMLVRQIIPYIDKYISKVYHTEQILYSSLLNLAGTADGIVDYNDEFMVLDFKTSRRVPKISWITDYFIQLFIYSKMIEEMYGTRPKKGVLLFCYKEQRSRNNQIIVNLDKYESSAMKRIELFHNQTQ